MALDIARVSGYNRAMTTPPTQLGQSDGALRKQMIDAMVKSGLSPEDAERAMQRIALRLGGASHDEALKAFPRIEPRRDRDGVVR